MGKIKINAAQSRQAIRLARQKDSRRLHRFSFVPTCFLVFTLAVILTLGLIVLALARIGIIFTPEKPNAQYPAPAPIRRVITNAAVDLNNINVRQDNKEIVLEITESQLTSLIQQAVTGNNSAFSDLQAAITPDYIEFFGNMTKPLAAAITVNIRPKITSGNLGYDLLSVKLGNQSLPILIINGIVTSFLDSKFAEINASLHSQTVLSSVELKSGSIIFRGQAVKK